MNTIAQLVQKTYLDTIEKAEAKVKDDVTHQKRDTELIVAALDKLTLKEQRPAMLILFLRYSSHFTEAVQMEMLSFAFDMTKDDLDTLTLKVVGAMDSCSEPKPREQHPITTLLEQMFGGSKKEQAEEGN